MDNTIQKKENIHKNHRERLRREMRNIEFKTLDDYKILELLLFNCHAQKDTNPIAHKLVNTFGNFANVLEASYEQLINIDGVGDATATFLVSLLPILERYTTQKANSKVKLTTTLDYVKIYGEIIKYSEKEYLGIVPLNNRYEGSKFIKIEVGENDKVDVKFNHIYDALRNTDYKKIILMHNHPSGNPKPSAEDFRTTQIFAQRLKFMNVEIVDSIIVSTNGHYSFKDSGDMEIIYKNISKHI